jgi:dienelactone hydrolase
VDVRRFIALAWLLVGLTISSGAAAGVRLVKPGKIPKLAADEGLVAIVVDTTSSLRDVRFRKDGRIFDAAMIKNVNPGATPSLYVMPAGVYEWSRVTTMFNIWYDVKESPEAKFKVEPGVLNYPGDMLVRDAYTKTASIQFFNRSLQVMDWLEETHPSVFEKYAFEYKGHYPDPFPKFYRQEKAEAGKPFSELNFARDPPAPGSLPVVIRDLWRARMIEDADLNPAGNLLVRVLSKSDGYHFELIDTKTWKTTPMMVGCCPVESMQWAGNDVFVVSSRKGTAPVLRVDVFRMRKDAGGGLDFDHFWMSRYGVYAQALPEDPNHILFASRSDQDRLMVHRVSIRDVQALSNFDPIFSTRINRGVDNDGYWFADGRGRLRVALARSGEDAIMLYGSGDRYEEVLRFGLQQPFEPMLLSYEGDLIYGLSDDGREQRDLVVFDPKQKKIVSTLFSKPGIDIFAPIVDEKRRPIGAAYFQQGHMVSEYFGEQGQAVTRTLHELFPGKNVAGYDRAENGDILAWVESSRDPGNLHHVNAQTKKAEKIASAMPWLDKYRFSEAEVFPVSMPDGSAIEAYLTRPLQPGKRPLVILSHGGPVGVRDERSFNPEVQLLAAMGYAVLQVNFRGSDGYGKRFREAGHKAHGTLIEDDIDAAVRKLLQDPGIDADRVCAVGASYGGYSAIVSTLRWPGRFKCAVSISGVTDWMLFFTSSDGGNSARGRQALEHYIGDPRNEADALIRNSPIYRFRELKTPLMFVHGAEDTRVDFEHMRRMVRMLNIAGVKPVAVTLEEDGHSFGTLDSVETAWGGIAGFLKKHLGDANSPSMPKPMSESVPSPQQP